MGDNGWIGFADDNNGDANNYGVSIIDNAGVYEFSGWAWNGNNDGTGVGWISFNCSNETGGCTATVNYKVTAELNQAPNKPVANEATINSKCSNDLSMNLSWVFSDPDSSDTQGAAYNIIIKDLDTGGTVVYNPGWHDPATENYFNFTVSDGIQYDTHYEFQVQVRDDDGAESSISDPKSFMTPDRKYPEAYFTWTPKNPSAGEEVHFSAVDPANPSKYYTGLIKNNCDDSNCGYRWVFTYDGTTVNKTGSTTTLIFPIKTSVHAFLEVEDTNSPVLPAPADYKCSTSTNPDIGLKYKLPTWVETK